MLHCTRESKKSAFTLFNNEMSEKGRRAHTPLIRTRVSLLLIQFRKSIRLKGESISCAFVSHSLTNEIGNREVPSATRATTHLSVPIAALAFALHEQNIIISITTSSRMMKSRQQQGTGIH
jgi:hypothetical protein